MNRLPARELSTLLKVSESLAVSLELDRVLQTAIESAVQMLRLATGAIYLLDEEVLYLGATTPPLPSDFPDQFRLTNIGDHPHIRKALRTHRIVYLPDTRVAHLSASEKAITEARRLRSILYIPLLLEKEPVGVLIVGSTRRRHNFTAQERHLCRILSSMIALSVANARLFTSVRRASREMTRAYDATLEGWSLALEMRDEATLGHTQRVTDMTLALAARMGLQESTLEHIRRGALLHDIGKMAIPDSILGHRGRLSDQEWAIMKTHPELAHNFLMHIDYLIPALDIPYSHHERWDGTGYPRGLKGEEIPLAARIFAVVDVFDALTFGRSYRKAWSREKAKDYIRRQAGKHFDPQVVAAFLTQLEAE